MTSINLVLRPSLKSGRCEGSLTLRLIHDRRVKSITLKGCRLYPEEWDNRKQCIIYPQNERKRTAYLKNISKTTQEEYTLISSCLQRLSEQGNYTLDELVHFYHHHKDEGRLCGYAESLCFELERQGKHRTARAYRTVTKGLMDFNKGRDIPLETITGKLIKSFESDLRSKGRLPNTISYYMRNLRAIYNKAVNTGRIICQANESPFAGTYTGVTRTMKRALSCQELKQLHDMDFSSLLKEEKSGTNKHKQFKELESARFYFLFSFYSRGMCFIDLAYLRKENIRLGVIRYVRKKTGRQIEIRITKAMQEIIDHFSRHVKNSPYVFPIIRLCSKTKGKEIDNIAKIRLQYETALRAQNIRLKELSRLSKVNKPVSTHWARHTWATMGKEENIPLNVISECLGHTSEKTTLIYLGLLNNALLDAANERISARLSAG